MKLLSIRLLSLIVISTGGCSSPPEFVPPPTETAPDDAIALFVGEGGLPGLAVGVIVAGETAYVKVAGVRKAGDPTPVAETDAFHIGSETKAMTALLGGMLVDQGALTWDAAVGDILAGTVAVPEAYRAVTLTQLLSHSSGLPEELTDAQRQTFGDPNAPVDAERRRMATLILARPPVSPPGTQYLYSNFNYVVAGVMFEAVSHESWESLLRERLFNAVGMPSAGFGAPATPGTVDAPWGHNPSPVAPGPQADINPALGPAGTVHANVGDMLAYLRLYLDDGVGPSGRIVSSEALQAIETSRIDISPGAAYGFGWGIFRNAAGDLLLEHDGSNGMFYTSILLVPEKRHAIVVMTNIGGGPSSTRVGQLLVYLNRHFQPDAILGL